MSFFSDNNDPKYNHSKVNTLKMSVLFLIQSASCKSYTNQDWRVVGMSTYRVHHLAEKLLKTDNS